MRKVSKKKNYLNALALLIAVPVFGYSLLVVSFHSLIPDARTMFAGAVVSLSASVDQNGDNVLAKQFADKALELQAKEQELNRREAQSANNPLTLITFGLSIVLLVLVALNFYLDMRRKKGSAMIGNFSVDLRARGQ